MLTAGRGKVGHFDKTPRLFLEAPHQLGEGKAAFVATPLRESGRNS